MLIHSKEVEIKSLLFFRKFVVEAIMYDCYLRITHDMIRENRL